MHLDLFSGTHDESKEVTATLTGDLRSKWHDLPEGRPHPTPDQIHVTPDRTHHILHGDTGNPKSGGHRHGTGRSGKTELPAVWNDDSIIQAVLSVARNPDRIEPNVHGRWKAIGVRNGVLIEVIVNPDGTIRPAWPVSGPGVEKNP